MKKLFLFFVLVSGLSFGQFTVSSSLDWQPIGEYYNSLYTYSKGNKILLVYDDYKERSANANASLRMGGGAGISNNLGKKYTKYEFAFSAEDDTIEKIYNIISDHFKSKQKEVLTLTFPEGNLYLNFSRVLGVFCVSFGTDQGGYEPFSMPIGLGGVEKMFGIAKQSKK